MNRNIENEQFMSDSDEEFGKDIYIKNVKIRVHQTRRTTQDSREWPIKRVPNGSIELALKIISH